MRDVMLGVSLAAIAILIIIPFLMATSIHEQIMRVVGHLGPEECRTYYDGCHCTVEALDHNIERAKTAESSLRESLERERVLREALKTIRCMWCHWETSDRESMTEHIAQCDSRFNQSGKEFLTYWRNEVSTSESRLVQAEARVTELETALASLHTSHTNLGLVCEQLRRERREAEAERDRLREALDMKARYGTESLYVPKAAYIAKVAELEAERDRLREANSRLSDSNRAKANRLQAIADQYAVDCL